MQSCGQKIPNLNACEVGSAILGFGGLMTSFAPAIHGQPADDEEAPLIAVDQKILRRRASQRERTLLFQMGSYTLNCLGLMIFVAAGAIPLIVPLGYAVCVLSLTGFFLLLSRTNINDRFEDHYLTVFQIAANTAIQMVFLIIAPQIGYAFLSIIFLILNFGALRMTARQAIAAWGLTAIGVAPIFMLIDAPISMPFASTLDRVGSLLCFVSTVGQSTFIGLYGSAMRRRLYESSQQLKNAYRRIEELAELDELTGAFNRRCIMRILESEIDRCDRSNKPCTVVLIDLDWFKKINDAFGHPTGDEVLRTFAITIFANIRTIDKFGRYGGEEFLLILPETSQEAASGLVERLRIIVSELDWSAFSPDLAVTISAGIATRRSNEIPEGVLARADSALYEAKNKGRNCVALA